MKDLSLHILDLAQNSVTAKAALLTLSLVQDDDDLITVTLADDGCGMAPELLAVVTDPFTTTRTTRKVGLGLPLLRMMAEQTGGSLAVSSVPGVGTTVITRFHRNHIDCPPLGDLADSLAILLQGAPQIDLVFSHVVPTGAVHFDTREVRAMLGPEISLAEPEVTFWLRDYLRDLEQSLSSDTIQ